MLDTSDGLASVSYSFRPILHTPLCLLYERENWFSIVTMSLSSDDAQKLMELLQFVEEHKDLMVGYDTKVPVDEYILIGSLTVLVRYTIFPSTLHANST